MITEDRKLELMELLVNNFPNQSFMLKLNMEEVKFVNDEISNNFLSSLYPYSKYVENRLEYIKETITLSKIELRLEKIKKLRNGF